MFTEKIIYNLILMPEIINVTNSQRDEIWEKITRSEYSEPPSLDDPGFKKSLKSLINSFYQDYHFITKNTDGEKRKKKFHFTGCVCKFKFTPSDHPYGGFLSKTRYGLIRFSLVEPKAPTIGVKFYIDDSKLTHDIVLVPHQNEQENPSRFNGIQDTFSNIVYRTWFDVPIHRHNNVNIVQAVTFPIFREVSKVFPNHIQKDQKGFESFQNGRKYNNLPEKSPFRNFGMISSEIAFLREIGSMAQG